MTPGTKNSPCLFLSVFFLFCACGRSRRYRSTARGVAAVYCGLVNDVAIKGYYSEREKVVEKFGLNEVQQIHASGLASQLAHKERMNRDLGGIKPWCRNQGREYADNFVKLNRLENNH